MSVQVVRPTPPTPYVIIPAAASATAVTELCLMPQPNGRVSLRHGNWRVSVSYDDLQAALDEVADLTQEDDDDDE